NKLSLPNLSPTCMTLELADRLISHPVGVAEDVFVKVGTFYFPTDFVVVDFDADPRVPLILRRSFLKTGRALIDVFKGELTLRVGKEAKTFNLDQTSRNLTNYNDTTANRIDVIDMACEEYSQEVLALEDDPTLPEVDQSYVNTEGDILLLEAFLNDDPSLAPPNHGNYLPKFERNLKSMKLNLTNLPLMNLSRLNSKTYLPISNTHFWKVTTKWIEVDKAKVDVIAKLPHPTTVKGIRSFLGHAGFYRRFIQDFSKIARLMTRLLEKDTWSTRSSARNIFPPLDNPELTIQRRSRTDLTLLNNSKMAAEGPGDLPVPDLQTFTESLMAEINKNLMRVLQVNQQVKAVTSSYETCGGPYSFNDFPATVGNTQNGANQGQNQPQAYQAPTYQAPVYQAPVHQSQIPPPQVVTTNEFTNFLKANDAILKNMQTNMTSLTNSNLELKNMFGQFMKMNTASSLGSGTLPECEIEVTKDTVHPTNNRSTKDVQPSVVSTESPILNSEPVISPIIEPVASPVSAPRPNQKPSIPYPSTMQDQKLRHKANDQREKFFQIFKDSNFNIIFVDALILMRKFGPSIKSLLPNKDKLCELARTLLNEHCLAVLLKKLPEKLGDPDKFLIPYLSPTCMTLELVDRLISHSVGVSEDVFVKVGTFHFPADFVVVDFDADPRVPLILGRSFLKTRRDLIDVFEGELTLRVGKEAITFNLDQISRYSANYNDMTANQIDVIAMACEEYSQEVLGFSDVIANDPTSPEVDQSYLNSEGHILLLEAYLNDDPSLPLPNQSNYLPEARKELKICEAKSNKSSIDEPPEVELKNLPPHLEYAFLDSDDKLPVIIVKDLNVEEKTALITVLKSHKQAIAWKLSDIKGIDPEFCTHIILMEEDFKPAAQHQRRVNPKIHDVIKNEVLKLLDAGLRYPTSVSPWVSPVHYVAKKSGFTVVENEENELILTRLVTGWRVCIDYCTFQRCMMAIFHDMIEKTMEVFMDDFSVFEDYFQTCLSHLEKMLKRCEDTNLCLNWEKSHFMVKDGIVLGHKIYKERIEVDKAKVDIITKLPHPTTVKGIRSFLSHAGFYRSNFAISAVLGQRQEKHFRPIHYASKTITKAESNYTTTEKEMLAEARLLRWVLLLQEFTLTVINTKGAKNLAADHLSRLENPHQNELDLKGIYESFPLETLNLVSTRANSSTSWFADFTNYHAENFIVKGMSSQ
nr:DNA-directed DNA polymerase [Tanacetum cinerariifolium]